MIVAVETTPHVASWMDVASGPQGAPAPLPSKRASRAGILALLLLAKAVAGPSKVTPQRPLAVARQLAAAVSGTVLLPGPST